MDDDLVYIPVPRRTLRRLVSDDSMMSSLRTSTDDWAYLGDTIEAMDKSTVLDTETLHGTVSYRSRAHSISSSMPSSPTLRASSSRATSAAPDDPRDENEDGEMDVPILNLDLDQDFDQEFTAGTDLASNFPPTHGMKQTSSHPDAPETTEGASASSRLRLRGGAAVMPWYCPRAGNRKPLAQECVEMPMHGGAPMVRGPHGPEMDPEVEEEEDGTIEEDVGGNSGGDAVDGAVEDEEEAPPKLKRQRNGKDKKRSKSTKNPEWQKVVRKHRTSLEVVDLMASFALMSGQRHHQNLLELISDICGTAPSHTPGLNLPSTSTSLGILATMSAHLDGLIRQAKVLDFHRMVALMQIALWVDCESFLSHQLGWLG